MFELKEDKKSDLVDKSFELGTPTFKLFIKVDSRLLEFCNT